MTTRTDEIRPAEADPQSTTSAGHRRVVAGGALLTGAMTVSGAGNYALNALLARWLTPEEFGDASLIVTLLLVVTALAGCLQLVAARYGSAALARSDHDATMAIRQRLTRTAWTLGGVLALAVALGADGLAAGFKVADPTALVIFGLSLPLFLAQAVERGILQGRMAFGRLAGSFLVEMVVRVVVSCALVAAGWGPVGVSAGLWASLLASLIVARTLVRPTRPGPGSHRPPGLAQAAGATTVLLMAQITISHGDLLLVKQRFDAAEAGTYAVVALLGRAVHLGSWSIATAMFPVGARAGAEAATTRRLVRGGVAFLAGAGAMATVGFWTLGQPVVGLLFSDAYAGAGSLLGPYVLATSLLAVANLLAMVDLAAGRHRRGHLMLGAAVVQTLLVSWSGSLEAVVWVQVIAMSVLVVSMVACSAAHHEPVRDHQAQNLSEDSVARSRTRWPAKVPPPQRVAADAGRATVVPPVPANLGSRRSTRVNLRAAVGRIRGCGTRDWWDTVRAGSAS